MSILSWLDHRSEYKKEFDNLSYSDTKKQLKALQAQLKILIESINALNSELNSLLGTNNIIEALKNFESDRGNNRKYIEDVTNFYEVIRPLCSKVLYRKKEVYDTFLLMEKNNSQSINSYSQADVRLKALRVILEKRFSTIEWLTNKNGVWSNYKKMTEALKEFQGLEDDLTTIQNAMFNHKKEKIHLWQNEVNRINLGEKPPIRGNYF